MNRFQSVSRVALVGVATAALLLGGVAPAFAVGEEEASSEVEVATEVQPELEILTPSDGEGEETDGGASDDSEDSDDSAELAVEPAAEAIEQPAEAEAAEDDDIVYTEFSGGGAEQLNPEGVTAANNILTGPRRKISGKVTLPAGAPKGWMSQVNVGADCFTQHAGGGCGFDIKLNRTTGAFTMMVPVARAGWTIVPGAYAYNPKGESANLVQQSWGQTCGVGARKSNPAGSGELKNVNLPMCLGATITGQITEPKPVNNGQAYYSVQAWVGGGLTQYKGFAAVSHTDGTYKITQIPRVKNVLVTLRGGQYAADKVWNNTYDVKRATPINTTSGSVSNINFTATPGFNDMCIEWEYCNKFYKEIMWMHDEGISTGNKVTQYGTTYKNYSPKQDVTREAMSAFLYRISDRTGYKASTKPRFVDVNKNHKFYAQIQWMGDMGISTGNVRNGKRYYDPSQGVTREAMSAFLYRMADRGGYKAPSKQKFVDVSKNHKFYAQIQWMGEAKISTGTTRNGKAYYDPRANVTREAMSAFLYRFDN